MARNLLFVLLVGLSGYIAAIAIAWVWYRPSFDRVLHYRPPSATRIYSFANQEIGHFGPARRTVSPPGDIPDVLKNAFIAVEDATFREHHGFRPLALLRCALRMVFRKPGCGGSTITQQLVKLMVLGEVPTWVRKFFLEIPSAVRVEKLLSKDEILHLYLNEVLFGADLYGVEEASKAYFGKPAHALGLGEAAMLAGLVKSPNAITPRRNPLRAKERQAYVLRRMAEEGFISTRERETESVKAVVLADHPERMRNDWYLARVRAELIAEYGVEIVESGGLAVQIAMDPELQRSAERALRVQLEAVDKRLGWRGPLGHVDLHEHRGDVATWREGLVQAQSALSHAAIALVYERRSHLSERERIVEDKGLESIADLPTPLVRLLARIERGKGKYTRALLLLEGAETTDAMRAAQSLEFTADAKRELKTLGPSARAQIETLAAEAVEDVDVSRVLPTDDGTGSSQRPSVKLHELGPKLVWDLQELPRFDNESGIAHAQDATTQLSITVTPLRPGQRYGGIVTSVGERLASVDLGSVEGTIRASENTWAMRHIAGVEAAARTGLRDILQVGDVVLVRTGASVPPSAYENNERQAVIPVLLDQLPDVQGAVAAIDIRSRGVRVMVGGYSYARSAWNRAELARRQPGSAFKPFVWGAAIASGKFTPATVVRDHRYVHRDPSTGVEWSPNNFERDRFEGDMLLGAALAYSKNTVAAKLIEATGVDAAARFAQRCGIKSRLGRFQSLALGAVEVTPLELVNAYATIAASGIAGDPTFILRVRDRNGKILYAAPGTGSAPVIRPPVAYALLYMMREVVDYGTGKAAKALGRVLPGKTGTSQNGTDAWFVGFSPTLASGVWVGYDRERSLGAETGASAALPAWVAFMADALKRQPASEFEVPKGIEFRQVRAPARSPEPPRRTAAFMGTTAR